MKDSPCKGDGNGCQERYVGCHSKCEKYLAWRAEIDKANANQYAYKESQMSVWNKKPKKRRR